MKSTKIVKTQSSTMDQSQPRLHQLVKTNQISDSKFTKIDKVDQDSENPVNLNRPKSTKIVPVSQNEPKVTQDLPKLMELTNIVRT